MMYIHIITYGVTMIKEDEHIEFSNWIKQLGRICRTLRLAQGHTQNTQAGLCGLDMTYYQDVEGGRRPVSTRTIYKLAQGFNVEMTVLFPTSNAVLPRSVVTKHGKKATRLVCDMVGEDRTAVLSKQYTGVSREFPVWVATHHMIYGEFSYSHTDWLKQIGRFFAAYRKEQKHTQQQMSDIVGKDMKYYQDIEYGRRPLTSRTLWQVCTRVGLEIKDIADTQQYLR